ncbi:4,5-DOPA dioxygenase extradiol [Novosphingobium sp. G106]|uniref:4,5-DOPA-extradiol-dioxygenase n=1 Tax=Novosphingobium sp. G106 TaxID=2849500 RepID=UPI001C2DD449|nr:4,5-DOPA dioxygenase extradiol [Novosphingobium sp. G106]MBV1687250.1 4,5-DOPA dioxygenase extradiol [Novosphingobium sp. G106]
MPVLFLGHGAPITAITDGPERRTWQALGKALPRPRAILAVTAHWETQGRTHVTSEAHPRTIHDFRGFPQELYDLRYPSPGSPELAKQVIDLLGTDRATGDESWGYDHGTWGVVQPMYPAADIPMVAMSLNRSLDTEGHFAIGRALSPLRDEGVLIVASGNVIHNLPLWFKTTGTQPGWAVDFRARTNAAILAGDDAALLHFASEDDAAAKAINSGEHYLPLLYALGARRQGDDTKLLNDTLDGALSMTSVLIGFEYTLA